MGFDRSRDLRSARVIRKRRVKPAPCPGISFPCFSFPYRSYRHQQFRLHTPEEENGD